MAKYSDEFKLKVVLAYLEGPLGYTSLAKAFNISTESLIKRWVRVYKEFGEAGLRRISVKHVYSVKFKLDVLHFMKQTGASYLDTAIQFSMNNPALIANWNSKFLKEGIEGLKEKVKGRPPMSKNPKIKSAKQVSTESREEQLEREVELLSWCRLFKKVESFSGESWRFSRKAQAALAFELREEGFRLIDVLKQVDIPEATYSKSNMCRQCDDENFFGLLKQEMYYGEELMSYEELKKKIERYMHYYNHERIKQKLAGMSPVKYRTHANQSAA